MQLKLYLEFLIVSTRPLTNALNVYGKADAINLNSNSNKSMRYPPNIKSLVILIPDEIENRTNAMMTKGLS
jgi:hypothetical protein